MVPSGADLVVGRPNVGSRELFHELVDEIFDNRWFTNDGPMVRRFENELAEHVGVNECVVVANGTLGLEILARALGLSGEVIVPSFSFVATAGALSWLGIEPVFADIDPTTHNIDPDSVRERITDRTSAILAVHLWGRPAEVSALEQIALEHDLELIFDSAHAFGNTLGGARIGNFGRAEVFSFHATKFFNCFEGGAVTTNDSALAERLRTIRNFGFAGFDQVDAVGTNAKMTEVCAAMGITNLRSLDEVVAANQHNYETYRKLLADIDGIDLISFPEGERNNYQYIVVEVSPAFGTTRDSLVEFMHAHGVIARRYFWPGIHRFQPYGGMDSPLTSQLPNTVEVADRVVVLPTGTSVSDSDCELVVDLIRQHQEACS